MVDLSVKMGNLVFKNPIITASATPTHNPEQCAKAAKAGSSAVILKTLFHKTAKATYLYARPRFKLLDWKPIIPEPRPGLLRPGEKLIVKEPRMFTLYSIEQSTVWDYDKYRWYIDETKKQVGEDCLVIASIMGGAECEGWEEQCEIVNGSKADAVELNFSCPHASEAEKGLGTDVGSIPEVAEKMFKTVRKNLSIPALGVKLTAQSADVAATAKALERSGVTFITAINRLLALDIDINEARPVEWGSYSGFGGPFMLPLSLKWVAKMREVGIKVPLSATSGPWEWKDAIKFIMVGADTVQTCTAVMCKGYEEITTWLKEMTNWMQQKGYNTIDEMKGIALKNLIPVDKIERELPIMVGGKSSKIVEVDQVNCKKHLRSYSCGWCERACMHDAIKVDSKLGYAVVDEEKCEACGMCSELCPPQVMKINPKKTK